ncbi:hypothetical protein GKZ90_0022725 [Flavobacterium sp. MC2016-06]|uniref:hypothetical protein n=1 Tax=Flavobacterium sp. MC2016-06 TaxID=2676308 RepID=UPI0012BA90BA|nr:hypothetical protein [Flavobacterium sp. MC2016-06]MBU3861525.1 hypothetical protein [Flavobacterium sp. MC2016-06]
MKKDSITISNYIKKQKLLSKNPEILVIKDKKWVDLINNYSNSKQKLINNKLLKKLKNESIAVRFKQNDPSVNSEIITIIKKGNNDSINKLFRELISYSFNNKPKQIDNNLKLLLFESINNPELETSTAFMISSLKIDGFEKIIENLLLSGKSVDEITLFYCLKDSNNSNTIDYIINSVLNTNKHINEKKLFNKKFISTLDIIICNKKGNDVLKEKSLSFCIQLLDKYPITLELLNKSSIRAYQNREPFLLGGDFENQLGILYLLIKNNDQRIIPFLKLLQKLGVKDNIQFDFLFWKFDEDKSDAVFNKLLSDFQYYFSMVYELDRKDILLNDDNLMIKVLSNFEKTPTFAGMEHQVFIGWNIGHIRYLMTVFYKLDKSKFLTILNNSIKSPEDKNLFIKIYEEYNRSSIDSYILNQKLYTNTSNKYDNFDTGVYLSKRKIDLCNSFLNDMKIADYKIIESYSPEYEDNFEKTIYLKNFLNVIKNHSNNELKNMDYFFENVYKKSNDESSDYDEKFESNCYITFQNMVYFIKVNEKIDARKLVMNRISEKLLNSIKSSNHFVELDFWKVNNSSIYTFGNPDIVNGILSKYDFKN